MPRMATRKSSLLQQTAHAWYQATQHVTASQLACSPGVRLVHHPQVAGTLLLERHTHLWSCANQVLMAQPSPVSPSARL